MAWNIPRFDALLNPCDGAQLGTHAFQQAWHVGQLEPEWPSAARAINGQGAERLHRRMPRRDQVAHADLQLGPGNLELFAPLALRKMCVFALALEPHDQNVHLIFLNEIKDREPSLGGLCLAGGERCAKLRAPPLAGKACREGARTMGCGSRKKKQIDRRTVSLQQSACGCNFFCMTEPTKCVKCSEEVFSWDDFEPVITYVQVDEWHFGPALFGLKHNDCATAAKVRRSWQELVAAGLSIEARLKFYNMELGQLPHYREAMQIPPPEKKNPRQP